MKYYTVNKNGHVAAWEMCHKILNEKKQDTRLRYNIIIIILRYANNKMLKEDEQNTDH